MKSTSPQPLPQEGGANVQYYSKIPPSLLGEGGQGDEVNELRRGQGDEVNELRRGQGDEVDEFRK